MRSCFSCGSCSTATAFTRKGTPYASWCLNPPTNLVLCHRCGHRFYNNKGIRSQRRADIRFGRRECYSCGAHKSTANTHGQLWYPNRGTPYFLCHTCYNGVVRRDYKQRSARSRIVFKGRRLYNKTKEVRVGVCNLCRGIIGIDCLRTNLHHDAYDASNPLANTLELCPSCHAKITQGVVNQ